ncbi:hypothetical protein HCN44_009832 [Aphidius gifuensis]|uniref:RRM domain-containing protein n=1 Tax=Aphidius gifuensis TaxID=684658 RepID=A0A835CU50_APHGI|nr:uncharacterized protein LOC122849106 [Aphidius gifuensis]KAF7996047.1 hypothetical protein HCN44_009832 [Aphidius gifuensis]
MADLSLDDIIKKKKPQIAGMKSRGGIRKAASVRGVTRQNTSSRVPGRIIKPVTDARLKIIQKNREKLTDARDKLAEIAKQSDARLKLEKLRASNVNKQNKKLIGISRNTGRNGKLTLSTNKLSTLSPMNNYKNSLINHYSRQKQQAHHHELQQHQLPRSVSYRRDLDDPHYNSMNDMSMDYINDNYLMDTQPIRRTVANDYSPVLPPPPPVFGAKSTPGYLWPKQQQQQPQQQQHRQQPQHQQQNQQLPSITRSISMRDSSLDRPRQFKVIARAPMAQKNEPTYRENWSFASKTRTIVADEHDDNYYDSRSNHRDVAVKTRFDSNIKSRQIGLLARPKTVNSSSGINGYRIVVSNLQANVTKEDIQELFEDVGELLVSTLVRPGTAEVIYKTLKDATKAVETYHNRQLDGHPMKCMLVNPRPKNNPTAPAVRPLTDSRRSGSSYVQPSIGAVHRALFDDGHN